MKRRRVDSQRERRILTAMVVSRVFLGHVVRSLDPEIISVDHFRIVATWCIDYYNEYNKAPGDHIEDIYHKWAEDNPDSDSVDSVKDFLEYLSDQHDDHETNIPYLLDDLSEFIAKRKIHRLQETLTYAMSRGDVLEAEESLVSYRKIEVGQGAGFDPLNDNLAWKEAFSDPAKPIITFEGDAGRFFNHALTRDALVGIQAPEKTGKTWWCVEFTMRALRQRRKVALFEVGDLSKSQILKRLGMRWANQPLWKDQCGKVLVPRRIEFDDAEDIGYTVTNVVRKVRKPISYRSVQEGIKRFRRASGIKQGSQYLRASIHATGTVSVTGLSSILDQWEQDHGFIPDVVIIDYADILAPDDKNLQGRDQVNDIWKGMRRLSQQRHALVIAPTQANAASYNQDPGKLQTMANFSEDKRKLAHCTAMMGLNQTHDEKEVGGMRLNWIALREASFSPHKALHVGTCYTLGRAMCCAAWPE